MKCKLNSMESAERFSIHKISHSDYLVKKYTGLPSFQHFQWLVDQVRGHAVNMQYYRGKKSTGNKKYQLNNSDKPGKARTLSIEDEVFITLMKLRLNLIEDDIALRFNISRFCVSQILSTWLPFLAAELKPFIYWPTQQEILSYYPHCFKQYDGCVRCIIDCTEIRIQRPSLALTNNAVYSQYKSSPTLKVLIGITPGATISFIS